MEFMNSGIFTVLCRFYGKADSGSGSIPAKSNAEPPAGFYVLGL